MNKNLLIIFQSAVNEIFTRNLRLSPEVAVGDNRIFCRSQIHRDICKLMFRQIDMSELKETDVYMGAHRYLFKRLSTDRLSVAIQTEQYYDNQGKRLWGLQSRLVPWLISAKYDLVLDLSASNLQAYPKAFSENLLLGPYIFGELPNFDSSASGALLHIGSGSRRRNNFIKKVDIPVQSISGPLKNLEEAISKCSGLLNVHYSDGDYIEWPRFLMAFSFGKIVYSERLPEPLKEGRHYSPVWNRPECKEKEDIFNNFREEIAQKYTSQKFINWVVKKKSKKNKLKRYFPLFAVVELCRIIPKRLYTHLVRRFGKK